MFRGKPFDLKAWYRKSAVFGGIVWLIAAGAALTETPGFWLMETLFLLGPLVVVPLGVSLIGDGHTESRLPLILAAPLQPVAAILVALSFLFRPGGTAGNLVAPWLWVTAFLGLAGLLRLGKGFGKIEELCFTAALLYLPVGGIWLVLSRLGRTPMGLSDVIVLLTAVHFHFAGFGACCLAGAVGRAALADGPQRYLRYRLPALGVMAGTFLVAIGFLVSPWPKFAAIVLFAVSLLSIAALEFSLLKRVRMRAARVLIGVSASSLMVGMVLAVLYGLGEARVEEWISIPDMAKLHGVINALGFTLCGLVGWTLASAKQPKSETEPQSHRRPFALHVTAEVSRVV